MCTEQLLASLEAQTGATLFGSLVFLLQNKAFVRLLLCDCNRMSD